MGKNQEFHLKDRKQTNMPSRADYRQSKRINKESTQPDQKSKQKKLRFSVPLLLLITLLLLPGALIMYFLNQDNISNASTKKTPGEEISFEQNEDVTKPGSELKIESEKDHFIVIEEDLKNEKLEVPEQESELPSQVDEVINDESTPEEEEAPEQEAEQSTDIKEQPDENVNSEQTYHIVKQGETLYRIAMTYYKNPDGIQKIQQANNLIGNEIQVGQKLKIPKP